MSNGKNTLERTIEILKSKHPQIDLEYKILNDEFYNLTISIDTIDGGRRNHIYTHEPYSDLDKWSAEDLTQRILDIINYSRTSE